MSNDTTKEKKGNMIFHTPSPNYLTNGTMDRTLKCLAQHLTKDDVFIDIGSHIGCVFLQTVLEKKPYHAYAFEPSKDVFQLLERNCKENELKDYTLVNAAVAQASGDGFFYYADWGSPSNTLVDRFEGKIAPVQVKKVALDDFDFGGKQLVVKIDAELSEPEVWMGLRKHIPNIRVVCMELFLGAYRVVNKSFEQLLKDIRNDGFSIYTLEGVELKDSDIVSEQIIDVMLKRK